MAETLEDRVRRLEDVAFEGDGLTRSIDRLGLNAGALGEALRQVDKQQQMLTKLGTELTEVRETSVTKDDLHEGDKIRRATTLNFRKKLLTRVYASALVLSLALVGIAATVQDRTISQRQSRRTLCMSSAYSSQVVRRFAEQQIVIEKMNRFIDEPTRAARIASLDTLRDAFPTPPCLREFHK